MLIGKMYFDNEEHQNFTNFVPYLCGRIFKVLGILVVGHYELETLDNRSLKTWQRLYSNL